MGRAHTKPLRIALVGVLLLLTAAFGVACCAPQIINAAITPSGDFDPAATPPAPDYADEDAWIALPSRRDEADVALADLPAADPAEAPVDTFFVHSTSSLAARWNTPHDDEDARAGSIRGGTLIQASVFNGCCTVFAPSYRQASGTAYTSPSRAGDRAIDVAYADVEAAFEEFLRRTGGERPFIVAGHSQGAFLVARLLRERILDSGERERLVAAYLPGATLRPRDLGSAELCTAASETGCVITFNARGQGHVSSKETGFAGNTPERERLCVNPVLGRASSDAAPRERHGGAVFFDAAHPEVLPAFAASQCVGGRLVVSDLQALPERDAMSSVLLWVMGGENYHPIEYQLFYVDLREDAARRVDAYSREPFRRPRQTPCGSVQVEPHARSPCASPRAARPAPVTGWRRPSGG